MKRSLLSLLVLLSAAVSSYAQAPLRTGDTVEIRISGVPAEDQAQISGSYTIDSQGKLNIPYIGEVRASGVKPAQVEAFIENNLKAAKIYTNPTISLQPPTGSLIVNVLGAVRQPQRITYTPDMTLTMAIAAAGGLNDFAKEKDIRLTREGKTTFWDLRDIRRRPATDPKILPGDSIEVFQSFL